MSVFVIGMHRSGTSAVTRVINLLGPTVCDSKDLLPPTPENPKGFWESASLTAFNDDLLQFMGGTWSGPPQLSDGWIWDARLDPYRERGRALFHSLHSQHAWVWKDPRNSLLLPFWINALNVSAVIIFVLRNPLEIARSLERRNGISKTLSLSLWERYMRVAIENVRGLPVLFLRYSDLLRDPTAWSKVASRFLAKNGIPGVCEEASLEINEFVDCRLRHASAAADDVTCDPDFSEAQRQLCVALDSIVGDHEAFRCPDLPAETVRTEAILAERRRGDLYERRRTAEYQAAEAERARVVAEQASEFAAERRRLEEQITALQEEYRRIDGDQRRGAAEYQAAEAERARIVAEWTSGFAAEQSRLEEQIATLQDERRQIEGDLGEATTSLGAASQRLELFETENEALSGEVLRLGKLIASQREREARQLEELKALRNEVSVLHREVASRQELIESMQRTRTWRVRNSVRQLAGRTV